MVKGINDKPMHCLYLMKKTETIATANAELRYLMAFSESAVYLGDLLDSIHKFFDNFLGLANRYLMLMKTNLVALLLLLTRMI